MKNCFKCGNLAFIENRGNVLCKNCFSHSVERRVKKAIKKYSMLEYNSHIAVGLSGGKDSVVLLTILKRISFPQTKLTAIIVDEGIENYRSEGIEIAKKTADKLQVGYIVKSYKSNFGLTLDDMLPMSQGKSSCALCGTFRRKSLNLAVRELGADYLATGHNLDDEAETVLLNLIRGDLPRFTRQTRIPQSTNEKLVPRIKPLVLVTQPEIVYYAIANSLEYHDDVCPYASEAMRNSVREFLQNEEKNHPGTLINIIKIQDEINPIVNQRTIKSSVFDCKICSEPTDSSSLICASCKFLEKMDTPKEQDSVSDIKSG